MTKKPSPQQPWGLIAGLLTACVATLVGVVCQLQPETILFRACAASFAVGLVVGGIVTIAQIAARES